MCNPGPMSVFRAMVTFALSGITASKLINTPSSAKYSLGSRNKKAVHGEGCLLNSDTTHS
jgi:hypothetical protein